MAGRSSHAATSSPSRRRAPPMPRARARGSRTEAREAAAGASGDRSRARPPHDRRHRHAAARDVRRPALQRRLLPRRQRPALLLMTHLEEAGTEAPAVVRALATRYLAFTNHAFDETTGRFHNFLTYARSWRDEPGPTTATVARSGRWSGHRPFLRPGRRGLCTRIFQGALPLTPQLTSPRAWPTRCSASTTTFARSKGQQRRGHEGQARGQADGSLPGVQSADWPWFEDRLTYCNARLPQALLVSASRMATTRWPRSRCTRSSGWWASTWRRTARSLRSVRTASTCARPRATFDQQPVEACAMVSACPRRA